MDEPTHPNLYLRLRRRTALILFTTGKTDGVSRFVDLALIVLISLNILAVVLESIKDLQALAGAYFYAFEVFSVTVFSVEYIARVWSVVDNPWNPSYTHPIMGRIKYMMTWMALIDLIAIAPFYLSFFATGDLRILRALRLLRIFKLTRYSSAMTLLFQVFREEARTIGAALFVSMLLMFVASTLAFVVEHPVQPKVFSSIPAAMYWATVTMTTVGYGDMVPLTPWGKILGAFIGIIGLGMVALPAGILASGFSSALHRRRAILEEHVEGVMEDGIITVAEQDQLDQLVQQLNLSEFDTRAIMHAVRVRQTEEAMETCPHCGKRIHEPGDADTDNPDTGA